MDQEQIEELRLQNNRTQAEIQKLMEESAKLRAEGNFLSRKHFYYPMVFGASLAGVVIAATTAVIKLLGI